MDIVLHNIQSIKDATLNLPDTGIVEFCGDNSNGKSILEKVISSIVKLDILDETTRKTLISDGETSGYVVMIHGKKSLVVLIDHVRDKTVFQYTPNIEDKSLTVTRTLREGGMEDIIHEFGWRVYDNNNLCLQVYPTFGAIPYINTSHTVNKEITEDVLRDKVADSFLSNYETITYPLVQKTVKTLKQTKASLEAQIANTRAYDYNAYESLADRLKKCKDFFEYYMDIHLDELELIPNVTLIDVPLLRLAEIPIVSLIDATIDLQDLSELISEISQLQEGVCPTCGRRLVEDDCRHDFN